MLQQLKKKTVNGRIKIVGEIHDDVFEKTIVFSKHHFRKANALGIDEDLTPQLLAAGVKTIRLKDIENGRIYTISLPRFIEKSWVHTFQQFQPQRFVSCDQFAVSDFGGRLLSEPRKDERVEKQPDHEQPSLF